MVTNCQPQQHHRHLPPHRSATTIRITWLLRLIIVFQAIVASEAILISDRKHGISNTNSAAHIDASFIRSRSTSEQGQISQLSLVKASNDARYLRQLSPSIGNNIRALVLLVKFPEHDTDTIPLPTREYFDTMCNTQIVPYLQKQSYGRYNIIACDVQEWKETDYSQEFYSSSYSNLVGSEFASAFFIPVLQQLDANNNTNGGRIDWTIYDTDQDGTLDAVIALHSGYGAEFRNIGDCNVSDYTNRIHSQGHEDSSGDWYNETVDGYRPWTNNDNTVALSGYAIASVYDFICTDKPATPGVITHEWIHIFGTPDLYGMIVGTNASNTDTDNTIISTDEVDLKVRGLGSYDVMSNARGPLIDGQPASLSVYTKYLIGWMTPVAIVSDGIYTLKPSSMDPSNAFVIRHPLFALNEYLLIEYRSASEYDVNLFGGGLLMYHVDDNQRVQGGSTLPYGNDASHLKVAVIQADGNFDIELGINNGDDDDFWKAGMFFEPSGVNSTKDEMFFPNTDSYYNGRTGLSVYIVNITNATDDGNYSNVYATIEIKGMGGSNNNQSSTISPISTFSPTQNVPIPTVFPSTVPSNIDSTIPSQMISNVPSDVPSSLIEATMVPSVNRPVTSDVSISPTRQAPVVENNDTLDNSIGDSMTSRSNKNSIYCVTSLLLLLLFL